MRKSQETYYHIRRALLTLRCLSITQHTVCVTEDGRLHTFGCEARLTVTTSDLDGEFVARCCELPGPCALAFAMATHERLGASSCTALASMPSDLVRTLVTYVRTPRVRRAKYWGLV